MPLSPQAITETCSPQQRGGVLPPAPIDLAAGVAKTIFNRAEVAKKNLQYLQIKNVGTGTVKVAINDAATANVYHDVLAVDTATEAGNGGVLIIPGSWGVNTVSCFSTAGSKIAVLPVVNDNPTRIIN